MSLKTAGMATGTGLMVITLALVWLVVYSYLRYLFVQYE